MYKKRDKKTVEIANFLFMKHDDRIDRDGDSFEKNIMMYSDLNFQESGHLRIPVVDCLYFFLY
jgi:hypothetical protein